MDNYLAKPIVADELFAALGQTDDKSDERRTPPHTIKSPLGTLGLDLALADELESLGKQRKLDKAATVTDRLARELERVISQLTSWTTAIPEETAS